MIKRPMKLFAVVTLLLAIPFGVAAQYSVARSVIGAGGGTASGNYVLKSSAGQAFVGVAGGANYIQEIGFWYRGGSGSQCTPGILGDVSADDLANSTDGLIILSYDAGISLPPILLDRIALGFGETNGDGLTNSTDALIILSYDAGSAVPFPVGQPVCLPGNSPLLPMNKPAGRETGQGRISLAETSSTGGRISAGKTIEIPVTLDLSDLPEKLGSYTVAVKWDAAVLKLLDYSGGSAEGFENPVINAAGIEKGRLVAAHAVPFGAEKAVNILQLRFEALGAPGASSAVSFDFSALAAASTFSDLLPHLNGSANKIEITIEQTPQEYEITNYPNPFNPVTHIRFALPNAGKVKIEVFNVLGQRVATLVNDRKEAGYHVIDFDGSRLASGVYYYRLEAPGVQQVKKMLLVK